MLMYENWNKNLDIWALFDILKPQVIKSKSQTSFPNKAIIYKSFLTKTNESCKSGLGLALSTVGLV